MACVGPETQTDNAARGARTESPPLTAEGFRDTVEFRRFKRGMKKILKVSKAEMDRRVRLTKRKTWKKP
jgi:hypothetical protein